jgi:hypothetical protein
MVGLLRGLLRLQNREKLTGHAWQPQVSGGQRVVAQLAKHMEFNRPCVLAHILQRKGQNDGGSYMEKTSPFARANLEVQIEHLKDQLRFGTAAEERKERIAEFVAIAQLLARLDHEEQPAESIASSLS